MESSKPPMDDDKVKRLVAVGKEHYDSGDFNRAEEVFSEVLTQTRGFADIHNMMGVIFHAQGKFTQAQECFEEALRINSSYTEAALNLSVTYNDLGRYEDARRVYSQAMVQTHGESRSIDPYAKGKIANLHADLGSAYHGIGFFEDAVDEYQKALKLCPTFVDIRTRLGTTLRDMGNYEAAISEFVSVKQSNPGYIPARIHLGVTYYSQKRVDEAVAEWEGVLREDPTNKSCQFYIQMVQKDREG